MKPISAKGKKPSNEETSWPILDLTSWAAIYDLAVRRYPYGLEYNQWLPVYYSKDNTKDVNVN